MKRIPILILGFAIAQFSIVGCDNNDKTTTETTKDTTTTSTMMDGSQNSAMTADTSMTSAGSNMGTQNEFVNTAANDGMMEVQLGELAQKNASAESVKNYGSMLAKDHSKANDELKSIAAAKNIAVPASLSADHASHLQEMTAKTGKDFDKAYIDMMVEDHGKAIDLFTKQSNDNSDAELQAFAKKTLPTLKKHLEEAKKLQSKM
jgi:putative membrane protein